MEFVTSIFGSICTITAECTISSVKNHVRYLCNHDKTVQRLKDQVDSLKAARERVQHSVEAATRNGEEIERDVQNWLATVNNKIDVQVERVLGEGEENAKKKCCTGFCPNIWARYKHTIKAEAEANAVAELLQQASFDRVAFHPPPQPTTALSVRGFEAFESRTRALNGIMEALREASVSRIGVHGMGGVGKTTLVKEVVRQVSEAKLFHTIIMVTITQSIDIEKIQNRIADSVGLKFEEQSMDGRADRLRQRLKKEESILVVLDDIWERLDLELVGIPSEDEHEGCCKILLTSRDLNVLSNGMDTQINFTVGILNEEEAWDFFKKMAGDCVDRYDLGPIAKEVAKKCAGLPIAIATVARALRNKSLFEWKDALRELNSPAALTDHKEVTGAVHSAIELSYNYLKSNEYKFTFLLCSLLGHDSSIENLLRYAIGLRVFSGVYTIQEARNRVLTVVNKLKASCLLLDSYDSERFDIHDVVCDVALSIASREYPMFVIRYGEQLERWPSKEMMINYRAINLCHPHVMIDQLPDEVEGSHLSFFCMQNHGPSIIPPNFFRRSERLKVLDLGGMHFPSLPLSIEVLTNLHTLCLKGCALDDISIVGKLKMLEILSLAHSYNIKALPKEIEQLTQLRLLDLSWCTKLQIIPPNVLASLSKLEELYMKRSFDQWEDEANASLEELKYLSHLTTLYVNIPNAQIIPKDLFIKTLDRYRILIGVEEDIWYREYEYSRSLRISRMPTSMYMDNGEKILFKNVENLYLDQLKGVKHLLFELNDGEGFPHLKKLHIRNSMDLQYIAAVKIEISNKQFVFHCLERLIIECCSKLEHLFSPSVARSLVRLESLEIRQCNSLIDVIFTDGIEEEKNDAICFSQLNFLVMKDLQNLTEFCSASYQVEFPSLQTLEIERCPLLKEFVNSEENSQFGRLALFNNKVAVPCLETMTISGLKNVEMIFGKELVSDSFCKLQEMEVNDCDELLAVFSSSRDPQRILLPFQNLRKLDIEKRGSLENVFPASIAQHMECFQFVLPHHLESLSIRGCGKLEHLFSPSTARSLVQLKSLEIRHCNYLRNVIFTEEEKDDVIRFPQLNSLVMKDLQNLIEFCSANYKIEFPLLKILEIEDCPQLKEFINNLEENSHHQFGMRALFNDKVAIPSLERMTMSGLKTVKMIFDKELVRDSFCKLQDMKVNDCDELLTVFSSSRDPQGILLTFQNLRKLDVEKCGSLENVFPASIAQHMECLQFVFPHHLESLSIQGCGKLEHLFSPSTARSLVQLKSLDIRHCNYLRDVIFTEEEKNDVIRFPQLNSLVMEDLQNLIEFCSASYQIEFPSLKTLEIYECPQLKELVNNLEENSQFGIQALFNNKFVSPHLESLSIVDCGKLEHLFSPSIARSLEQLKSLYIRKCNCLRDVIFTDSREEEKNDALFFPQLSSLLLFNLEELKCFYPGQHTIAFPMLKKLKIDFFLVEQGTEDSSGLVDFKPWISEDTDKVKSWRIPDNTDPSHLNALRLPDAMMAGKVVRLLYTNSGHLLALASNAFHKHWEWKRSERNPLGKATAYVALKLWQPPSGALMTNDISSTKTTEESSACIAISKNDCYLISASGGKVSLFNMKTCEVVTTFMSPPPAATFLAFYPQDNNIIAIGMEDSTIQIYNVRVDEVKAKLKGHQSRITGLTFSKTLNSLVSSGADAQLCVWSIDGWEKKGSRFIQAPPGRQSPLAGETKVQFHNDQTHILVVHESQIAIYDSNLECLCCWFPKDSLSAPISSAIYSCEGSLIYAGFCDGAIGIFDSDNFRLRCRIAPSSYIPSFSVSSNSAYPVVIAAHPSEPNQFALGMSDGAVYVVEPSDADLIWGTTPSQDNGSLSLSSS